METYDYYEDKLRNTTYTVFELVEGSSIQDIVINKGTWTGKIHDFNILDAKLRPIGKQILEAIKYLHS